MYLSVYVTLYYLIKSPQVPRVYNNKRLFLLLVKCHLWESSSFVPFLFILGAKVIKQPQYGMCHSYNRGKKAMVVLVAS